MSGLARHAGDAAGVVVALWFLLAPRFDGMPAQGLLDAVAVLVLGLSAWRIWRRARGGA